MQILKLPEGDFFCLISEMFDLILKNAKIASAEFENADPCCVFIKDGLIAKISKQTEGLCARQVLDLNGEFLHAGFIDTHFHGAANFDICDDCPEAIFKVAQQKLKEGVTSIVPATLTISKSRLKSVFKNLLAYAKNPAYTRLLGVHLEGPFINPAMAGAQNTEFARAFDLAEVEELNSIFKILKVSFSPELNNAQAFVCGLKKMGIAASCAHTNASFSEIKNLRECGLMGVSHYGNRCGSLVAREIGVVGAGLMFDDFYLELIADKIHLSPDFIRLVCSKKDLSKIVLVTDSMRASGLENGVYDLGGLSVKVENGAARLCSNSALAGSVLTMNLALKNLCEILKTGVESLSKCAAQNAAQSLNLKGLGAIKEGQYADFAVLNSDFEVLKTIVGGIVKFER